MNLPRAREDGSPRHTRTSKPAQVALSDVARRRRARAGHRRRRVGIPRTRARPTPRSRGPRDVARRRASSQLPWRVGLQRAGLRAGRAAAPSGSERRPIELGQLAVFGAGDTRHDRGRGADGDATRRARCSAAGRSVSRSRAYGPFVMNTQGRDPAGVRGLRGRPARHHPGRRARTDGRDRRTDRQRASTDPTDTLTPVGAAAHGERRRITSTRHPTVGRGSDASRRHASAQLGIERLPPTPGTRRAGARPAPRRLLLQDHVRARRGAIPRAARAAAMATSRGTAGWPRRDTGVSGGAARRRRRARRRCDHRNARAAPAPARDGARPR